MAAIAFAVGVPSALSSGLWKDVKIFELTFFRLADFLTANILLPLGGILIAIFAGWAWGKEVKKEMLSGSGNEKLFKVWLFAVRVVAPLAVGIVMISNFIK